MHRFKRGDEDRGAVATEDRIADDRPMVRDRTQADDRTAAAGATETEDRDRTGTTGTAVAAPGTATRDAMHTARARQRDEYGGINWGASFFGWLVAVGVAALLTAILAAAGAALDLTTTTTASDLGTAEELSLVGAIALLAVLLIAYFAGGYVAGRMSRFDGARQGIGAWLLGLIVTVVLAVVGAILGSEYNVLERLDLPALPVGDSELATGGALALAIVVVGTLVAAVAGGKTGERYHRKVDRAGFLG